MIKLDLDIRNIEISMKLSWDVYEIKVYINCSVYKRLKYFLYEIESELGQNIYKIKP